VVEADWTPRGAAQATALIMRRQPKITAIFVQNDTMAIGVLSQLAATGRRAASAGPSASVLAEVEDA
jgi:DNA-binding LacI/PurR family transcriptional regulator